MITDNRLTKALPQNRTLSYAIGSILILSKNAFFFQNQILRMISEQYNFGSI